MLPAAVRVALPAKNTAELTALHIPWFHTVVTIGRLREIASGRTLSTWVVLLQLLFKGSNLPIFAGALHSSAGPCEQGVTSSMYGAIWLHCRRFKTLQFYSIAARQCDVFPLASAPQKDTVDDHRNYLNHHIRRFSTLNVSLKSSPHHGFALLRLAGCHGSVGTEFSDQSQSEPESRKASLLLVALPSRQVTVCSKIHTGLGYQYPTTKG